MDANDLTKSSMRDQQCKSQIEKDVYRTFCGHELFKESMKAGQNPLYNVLVAYSRHNPDVGYCQGMNYLTGLILVGVGMKEDLAFTILIKLMEADGFGLAGLYDPTLKKLFEFADHVYSWLLMERPKLEECFSEAGLPLTTMLASPFMALFANIADL